MELDSVTLKRIGFFCFPITSIFADLPAYPGRYTNSAFSIHCHVTVINNNNFMFFQACIILPVVEEQGRTCGGQAKVEALRINLNVEGRLWHSSSSPSASFLSRSPFSLAPTCEKYAEIDVSFFEIF
jgi:hypothetical protein